MTGNTARYLAAELNGVEADEIHTTWAAFHLPVHGTSVERALSIIEDQEIYSFARLQSYKPHVIADNQTVYTDKLDLQLGLHEYVFLNLGRVHPIEVHPLYFIFPNRLIEESGAPVALREIVHFNAIVSREGAYFQLQADPRLTLEKITTDNAVGAERFFANTFPAAEFCQEIFPRFLQKHFQAIHHFSTSLEYPGTSLTYTQVGRDVAIHNAWEGPQVMAPSSVPFSRWQPSILITRLGAEAEQIAARLHHAGFPSTRIFRMDEVVDSYQKLSPLLGPYESPIEKSTYICLALRDLALLREHNISGENYPESMNGFKNRCT